MFRYSAGVPIGKTVDATDGGPNFLFGRIGKPDGPGHEHIATDRKGDMRYNRKPFDPHGAQNFLYIDSPDFRCNVDEFREHATYLGVNAVRKSSFDWKSKRLKINIYFGGKGGDPFGEGYGHHIFFQDDPT